MNGTYSNRVHQRKTLHLQHKESSLKTQLTFDLSLACEEQCKLLISTVIFWQSKILKFRGDCTHILPKNRFNVADSDLEMSNWKSF